MSFIPLKLFAQPFDTLLLEFREIQSIYPLDDGTFILIGDGDSTIRVSKINSKAQTIWYKNLVPFSGHHFHKSEIHLTLLDSSIQVLTSYFECDFYPSDTALVFTLDLDGDILDTIGLAYEFNKPIFLLSGKSDRPRCATLLGDSIILHFAGDSTTIIEIDHTPDFYFKPIKVDICVSGNIIVLLDFGSIRVFQLIGDHYTVVNGSFTYGNTSTTDMICIDDNFIFLINPHVIYLVDTTGFSYLRFSNPNAHFYRAKWQKPYLYLHAFSNTGVDSFYVFDTELNPIYRVPKDLDTHYVSDFAINETNIFTAGFAYYGAQGGFLESENRVTHEGPKYYDVELLGFDLPIPDSFKLETSNVPDHYIYYFSEMEVSIRNNCDYMVSEIVVDYRDPGFCTWLVVWQKLITNMNLLPGETKTFTIQNILLARDSPLYGSFEKCISIIRPDNHADDNPSNNEFCKEIIITDIGNSDYPFIRLNPNPASDFLFVHSPVIFKFEIRIYDMNGILVLTEINPHASMDIQALTPGMYIVQYVLPGGEIFLDKFVKI